MAKMIPDIDPESIENSGEKAAYKALSKQLPANWVVRHHYPFCWQDGWRLRDGEADFIVIAPGRGLLVVEVKGSHGFDCQGGQWYRIKKDETRELTENPFEQATRVKHQLVKRIAAKVFHTSKDKFPGVYGHIVMYPNGKIEGGLPSSTEPVLMIAHKDMHDLKTRFDAAFEAWGGRPPSPELTPYSLQKIVSFLSDSTKGVPVLAAKAEEDDSTIEELTRLQFRSFKGLLGGKRIHVTGPAGSGKTLLARWTAQLLADRGERILLTCFNRALAEWLRGMQPSENVVQIESFFTLCRKTVTRAGLPWNPPNGDEAKRIFWSSTAPALFDDAIGRLPPEELELFDGIIIDEGQDFHPDWWIPLMLLLKDPDKGRFCVFSDPEQRGVYGRGESYPSGLIPFELEENCRNTRRIASYCGNVIGRNIQTTYLQPEGSQPVIIEAANSPRGRSELVKAAYGRYIEMGFKSSQIAILSPLSSNNPMASLAILKRLHTLPILGESTNVHPWKEGQCVWGSTIKAFKGLEADCIILTDATVDKGMHGDLADLYVGTTRAKHQLTIIPCSETDATQLGKFLLVKT